jgi:membrane-associated phospholipid phosphatase
VEPGTGRFEQHRLTEALFSQEFRNIQVDYNTSKQLVISASNDRLAPASLAVGRAARTALKLAPFDAREIKITYLERTKPVVTYSFFDLPKLERYFSGDLTQAQVAEYVAIEYLERSPGEKDPYAFLNDVQPTPERVNLAATLPEIRSFGRVADDVVEAAKTATDVNWLYAGAIGVGLVAASSVLDRRADQFAKTNGDRGWLRGSTRFANTLPFLGMAFAGVAALDTEDRIHSRTGFAAGEAGLTAAFAATGLKYAIGRARPTAELGNRSFDFGSNASSSLPSIHSAVAWAVATPFALEYDAPWLYGVAALTNIGRVAGRDHWVSDTVAGSLLGYGLGRIFWQSSRTPRREGPQVLLSPSGIAFSWNTD